MFLSEKQKKLIESDAKINNIARVSVWLFNTARDTIYSEAIYSLENDSYSEGLSLYKKDCPLYFKALEENKIIAADSAYDDPNRQELNEKYHKPLEIISVLDVPIFVDGKVVGVICHEHTKTKRVWTENELFFAKTISELFAHTLEAETKEKIHTELQASEERFRSIAEKTNIIPWTTDAGMSRVSYVGPQAERLLGYPVSKWYEKNFWPDHIHPEDRDRILQEAFESQKLSKDYDHEYRMIAADGRVIWFRDIVAVEKVSDDLKMLRGYLIDITERKKFEVELQVNEERFRLLAESTDIIPWVTDAKTFQFTYVGPQAERILGYQIEEWYTQDFWPDHIHPDDKEETIAYCLRAYKELKNYEFEYRMIAKDGSIVWLHDVVTVESLNNVPITLRGYLINITDRKIADQKIQKLNSELELRVQERTAQLLAINKELERAKTSAEESRTAKELFLANMSHEIRTPLNAIIGFQQLLKESVLNTDQREFIDSIDFASRNLLVIINDILDLSKIEAGKFQFEEGEFDVTNTIRSVVELVQLRANEKNLKLVISEDPVIPPTLLFDATRLSQILLNLVGNAIKFTNRGEVKITTRLVEEFSESIICEFAVEDTGIGISQEMLSSIFERFTQESVETTRKYGGTGLGLTISRSLVEMQGGTIQASSEKGKGSVFSFRLRFKKVLHKKDNTNKTSTETILLEPTRKLNILLAEDVLLNQRLMVKIMEKWHHNLDIADNGRIAVEKVKNNQYDLILMDIQMPEMDGYEATSIIRALPDDRIKSIPIVALTAHASTTEAEKCINLGMNSYIAKPFSQQKLQQVIAQLIIG